MNVLSLFDGMSCGQIALSRCKIKVDNYFASEIDKYATRVTQENYPSTIQLGDVTKVKASDLPKINLLIGGSPCQGFSFAGKQLNFNDPRSALFFEYVRIWKEVKEINPDAKFLLENVNMKKEHLRVISEYLEVFPVRINSNLVSAQNRDRWYWTNIRTKKVGLFDEIWSDIPQPKDEGILLKDILQSESEIDKKYYLSEKASKYLDRNEINKRFIQTYDQDKAICVTANFYKGIPYNVLSDKKSNCITSSYARMDTRNYIKGQGEIICVAMRGRENGQQLEPRFDNKTNSITTVEKDNLLSNGYKLRRLTPMECERLQTVPSSYTSSVSDTQRYKMLGNGWTVDVIAHIFSFI